MDSPPLPARWCGVLAPLSALHSPAGIGCGEFPDLVPLARWAADCGVHLLQLLPVLATPDDEASPYTTLSSFALDPLYLRLQDCHEVERSPAARELSGQLAGQILREQRAQRVHHAAIRTLKRSVIRAAASDFRIQTTGTPERRQEFAGFCERHRHWLLDYCRYRSLVAELGQPDWRQWPAAVANRQAAALEQLDHTAANHLADHAFEQWLLHEQWQRARTQVNACGVVIMGDLPFAVAGSSADTWTRPEQFDLSRTVGAPPDALNPEGQDWSLPAPRWEVMATDDHAWWRARLRRASELFDAVRLDHVIGMFRTFTLRGGRACEFTPATDAEQIANGERLVELARAEFGERLVLAEDLGTAPDYLAPVLKRNRMPGYAVMRWCVDPRQATPPILTASVATTGTHDMSALAGWWESELDEAERAAWLTMVTAEPAMTAPSRLTLRARRQLLGWLLQTPASGCVLTIQDVFGWRQRFNEPGTMGPHNWTWRLPVEVEYLASDRRTRAASEMMRELIGASNR
jgi:4-alpha-glucanotransferase